jgi:hypothetical protein
MMELKIQIKNFFFYFFYFFFFFFFYFFEMCIRGVRVQFRADIELNTRSFFLGRYTHHHRIPCRKELYVNPHLLSLMAGCFSMSLDRLATVQVTS